MPTTSVIPLKGMAAENIDSDQYVDGSIDAVHMSANSIDSDAYVDGSIDAIHLSANSVDSDAYVDASIDNAHLADDAVGVDELSATGTASSSTFLRGDNAWAAPGGVTIGTPVASTSGTAITFTGIPAGTKRISVIMNKISSSSTSGICIRLGDAGGIETSGYLGNYGRVTAPAGAGQQTTGFSAVDENHMGDSAIWSGVNEFLLQDASTNTWIQHGTSSYSNGTPVYVNSGSKSLSAELTQIQTTTYGGSNTFDLGTINIHYE